MAVFRDVLGTDSLHVRALALLYLAGTTGKPVDHLASRRGEPALAFDVLDELGTPLTVLELAREGYRVSREPLWLLMGLLAAETAGFGCEAEVDDDLPPQTMTGPVPGWAVDSFILDAMGDSMKDIRERFAAAGMDPEGYSGHSLRAGFATSAAQAGASTLKIRAQTGHASDAMLSRYIRDGELFVGNAAGAVL